MKGPKGFADLADLPEDDRIEIIGRNAMQGQRVGFIVDDDEKADRYIEKLTSRFNVEVASRGPGPVEGHSILVIVVKKEVIH